MNYETFIDCLKSNANIFRILNCKLKLGQAKYLENDDDFNKYLKEQVITDLKELLLGIKDHHLRYGMVWIEYPKMQLLRPMLKCTT